jgi:hypothetical protein
MCYPGQLLIATEINSPDVQCVCMCVCVCVCMCTYSHMYQCNPVFGWLGWVLLHLIPVSSSTGALKLHIGNAGIGQCSPRPSLHMVSTPLDPSFHMVSAPLDPPSTGSGIRPGICLSSPCFCPESSSMHTCFLGWSSSTEHVWL